MKISELWLREWINPSITREALAEKLTLSGLEIESITQVCESFSGVVIGEIEHIEKHPKADRLQVCTVKINNNETVSIVSGAQNIKTKMKVAVALPGAQLSNKFEITKTTLRDVPSEGMLCSATELGLAEQSENIFEFTHDAPIGVDVWEFLKLNDYIFDVSITPNRGDCLSIKGLATEISALTETHVKEVQITAIPAINKDVKKISLDDSENCPQYVGRVIRNVKTDSITPHWLQERLRRSGIRLISPVVDVMNYVMLELGQPMHAFDLAKLEGDIKVRKAQQKEKLALLDGQTVELHPDTLLIADEKNPLAIAGVMGGLDSSVTLLTKDIFLESAYFNPEIIARARECYKLTSESSYRFERGVDPTLQSVAIERATTLILEIAGGEPGPIIKQTVEKYLPKDTEITLREDRLKKLLGYSIDKKIVESIFSRLGLKFITLSEGWKVTVPPRRFDLKIEVDLIEEIARIYGYDAIPEHEIQQTLDIHPRSETQINLSTIRKTFCDLGYNEVVTYSFVDKQLQSYFDSHLASELLNPITQDMAVMRTNLWPGLINTFLYNYNRQESRVRIFETGLRFIGEGRGLVQENRLAGLVSGLALPEQWGIANRNVDFFDLKGDLQNIFDLTKRQNFTFQTARHLALHPGQTAEILCDNKPIGVMGRIHPELSQKLELPEDLFLFDLSINDLLIAKLPESHDISKFPEIRRDLAILIDETIPAASIRYTIQEVADEWLKEINIFDVYKGKGVPDHQKSVALSLTLQHSSRTLVDDEVTDLVERVVRALKDKFAAELRG